ncbi:S1C family serine protease [Salidesulfovibrio onnuriiensis]|uniref:S1C family serine protease n=1 Tax=Salidesulfovibrio onnuriiensis TaxID=2583823 RepID=UPI0011C92AAA|nr:trypsin-like peptidase domain-containing protein [Salidesulfovibrio onnuriiensis]
MKRILCAVLLVVLFSSSAFCADLSKNYRNLYKSVVTLMTVGRTLSGPEGEYTAARGLGSGVLISRDGLILTAAHVVQVADKVGVKFYNDEEVEARVISALPSADLALVRAESVPPGIEPVALGSAASVQAGNEIFVISAPYGLRSTITSGIVSARYETGAHPKFWQAEMLQVDAAVNKGSSGGPLFDMKGRCIGIVSHLKSKTGGFEGHAFAVTTDTAKEYLIGKPAVWTGFSGKYLDEEMAWVLNLPTKHGYLVEKVADGSLGQEMGLLAGTIQAEIAGRKMFLGGDIILEMNDVPVGEFKEKYDDLIRDIQKRGALKLKVLRGGMIVEMTGEIKVLEAGNSR